MSKTMKFEDAVRRLEEIVKVMENGQVSLEESMKLYAEGVGLISTCNSQLEKAEAQVMKLIRDKDGELKTVPFDEEK